MASADPKASGIRAFLFSNSTKGSSSKLIKSASATGSTKSAAKYKV
jgi:hypothetical protein